MERWYVLRTKPYAEQFVSRLLEERGVPCYCPQLVRRSGRSLRVEPLFPGYLFARLDRGASHWKLARWSPGVAYIVGSEWSDLSVPDDVVAALQRRVALESDSENGAPFAAGERVVIGSGPLNGLEAIFDRVLSPSGRSRVLLEVVSRLTPVEVELAALCHNDGHREAPVPLGTGASGDPGTFRSS